jgi:hypothetical protein
LASLLLLPLLSGDAPAALGPVAGWLPAAVGVLAIAAFLRFSVLFPQSLTPAELRGLGKLKPDDSMGRADRALGRLAHSMLGRAGPVDAPRLPKRTLHHLVQRLPTRMQRIARFTVVKDAGRLLTEPPVFWSIAAGIAATPYLLWWAFEWLPTWLSIGLFFVWFSTIPMAVLLGVAVLRHGYAVAAPVDRRRMRWIIESLNAAVWAMIAMGPFSLLYWIGVENALVILMPGIVFSVVPLLVIGGFTVAVLYGGALEPRLAVRRSTIYGLFGFALAFVYAVIEELVSTQLVARVGLSEGSGTLMAAGVIAAVFGASIQKFRLRAEAYLRNAAASPRE